MSEAPRIIMASRAAWDAFWQTFAEIGPRHRNVARLRHDLGWTIDPKAEAEYLAPESGAVNPLDGARLWGGS